MCHKIWLILRLACWNINNFLCNAHHDHPYSHHVSWHLLSAKLSLTHASGSVTWFMSIEPSELKKGWPSISSRLKVKSILPMLKSCWRKLVTWFVLNYYLNPFFNDEFVGIILVTAMLVTDVGDQMCCWQVWDVGDRFRMLVTDLIHWENHQHNEKSRQHNDFANIWNQSPT